MMITTLRLVANVPGPFGNRMLKVAIKGFVGTQWIDIPFETVTQAKVYAVERGWNLTH